MWEYCHKCSCRLVSGVTASAYLFFSVEGGPCLTAVEGLRDGLITHVLNRKRDGGKRARSAAPDPTVLS